jgi:membrane protein YqaA with SNARE-associated domain
MTEMEPTPGLPSGDSPSERRDRHAENRVRRRLLHVHAVLHRWAEAGWAGSAVGAWGVLQASVVPGPADALIAPLALSDPSRAFRLAAWAVAGSTLGGSIAFGLGAVAFEAAGLPLLRLVGIGDEELALARTLFEDRGWLVVLLSGFSPISPKVIYVTAGAFGMPFPRFLLVLFAARTVRFLVVATVLRFAGMRIVRRIENRLGRPIATLR